MKRILIVILACLSLTAQAQDTAAQAQDTMTQAKDTIVQVPDSARQLKIAFLSYDSALKAMPDYTLQQQKLADLKAEYEKELKRVEDEFNLKYEQFLDGQKDFPKTILYKRQTELKELMERNIAFKADSQRELAEAERAAMASLRQSLNELLAEIAKKEGYKLIINTDADACPYIDPQMGEDINQLVHDALK